MHVYSADGKSAEYESLTVSLFMARYIQIMEAQTQDIRALMSIHLVELMADAELNG